MSEQHERFEALVTKKVEGAASEEERAEIESHLASCSGCRAAYEAEKSSREAMSRETKAFTEGYDAGRLEANLASELRSGSSSTRWLSVLGALFGLLTIVLYLRPFPSQPDAGSVTLSLTLGILASLLWNRRKQGRFVAIARAAEGARGGYRDLERARVQVNVREFRMCGRFGIAVAFAVPTVLALWGLLTRIRLKRAFPAAEVNVNLLGSLVSPVILSAFLVTAGLYFLWKARRLEQTIAGRIKGDAPSTGQDQTP
jgi:hypothetical protein